MASTAAASNLWLGGFAAAVQGAWQAMAAGHGDTRPRHQQLRKQQQLGGERKTTAVQGAAAAGGKAAKEGDVARCGGAMSDTTVYLLLDRFAPS
ncbi:hypothetical protein PAHAL_3G481900 [Panicum hallii]|jgi:hypothetical protein|uniref:Uncharacterized protein n=1 Tax=Panicum hallii TaxID=206008 RepID=A0A270R6T7_9POAL|nr:uncharacterized protein LOC112887208 [Panicum hallii]PVH63152.1 hypothetical protein PAHAL_3G481900 [Panicum hallii]